MKKSIKIIITLIVIIIISIIAMFVTKIINDLKQEENLVNELNSLFALLEEDIFRYDEIDKKLSQTVTTGDYNTLEVSIKSYMSDIVSTIKKLESLGNDEDLNNVLTIKNFESDGPKFSKTTKILNKANKDLDDIYSKINAYFSEEGAMSYIENKGLDSYYIELYKEYMFENDEINIINEKNEIIDNLDKIKEILDIEEKMIKYLITNKQNWRIEDDTLVFNSKKLSDTYNKYVDELSKK